MMEMYTAHLRDTDQARENPCKLGLLSCLSCDNRAVSLDE